jgi:hypothetical protein
MLDERLRKLAHEWAERTAAEQGLPPEGDGRRNTPTVAQILGPEKASYASRSENPWRSSFWGDAFQLRRP